MGANTDEVALYLNLQGTFDLQSAKLYQGSSNTKFTDSYCKKYAIYYSEEQVAKAYLKISYADGTSDGLIDVNGLPTLDDEGWFDEFK